LERQFAIHEHMRPGKVEFTPDVSRRIASLRKDIRALGTPIPVVSGIRQVQVRVPELKVIVLGRTELEVG
jgi:hypothetical protein